ncbi:MYPU_1760 family metalloprotease [Mycoplasma sp. 4404]|uniref:MYPU_1760 family metalloprotease n=1 Tax=Mycoplasma sp. 4404 TaxID=3108530 RepID=UPI002B1D56A0|nr:hypothetical protein [Mycoplasma sp. 4404]MEA4162682.1 hypothetical protein [Mycoplasma sp. 4404]
MTKLRKSLLFLTGSILGLGTLVTNSCSFLDIFKSSGNGDKKQVNQVKLRFTNYTHPTIAASNVVSINDKEFMKTSSKSNDEVSQILNRFETEKNNVHEYEETNGSCYFEYIDPYTNVTFRDYAYYVSEDKSERRYLLGPEGLVLYAHEFKRKIPFSTEVFDLEAININNFSVIDNTANGLYIPNIKNIFINGFFFCESGMSLYEIIAYMMQTTFHEYMHHWANSYAEIAFKKDVLAKYYSFENDDSDLVNPSIIYYSPGATIKDQHNHLYIQYWNKSFVDSFQYLLNYDVTSKSKISDETWEILRADNNKKNSFIHNVFSPKDIWDLSNGKPSNPDVIELNKKLKEHSKLYYSPDTKFGLSSNNIRYYYSLTELVPREYLKYGFEPYFNINLPNPIGPAMEDSRNKGQDIFTMSYFSYAHIDKTSSSTTYTISPTSLADDMSKVFLNNFDSQYRQGWYIQGDLTIQENSNRTRTYKNQSSILLPTTPFALSEYQPQVGYRTKTEYLNLQKIKQDKSVDFYKLFLDTMGYGKTISQLYYDNSGWKWIDSEHSQIENNEANQHKIKLSGYLDSNEYTGFVFVNPNNNQVTATSKIKYLDTFNFFGHKTFDKGALLSNSLTSEQAQQREEQLNNRIYPNSLNEYTNALFIPYISEDFITKPSNNSVIYLWKDLNNNNIAEENEILLEKEITLPENRWVTTARSTKNENVYNIIKTTDNKVKLDFHKLFR